MKTTRLLSFMGLAVILILSSCSMDKKLYTSGYHIEWNSKKINPEKRAPSEYASNQKSVNADNGKNLTKEQAEPIEKTIPADASEITNDENLSASLDKSISLPKTEKINFNSRSAKTASPAVTAVTETKAVSESKTITKQEKKELKKAARKMGGGKSQLIALLLCIFLGMLGIHRFYLGYIGLGIMYLLFGTLGVALIAVLIGIPIVLALMILVLIDLIRIIMGSLKPKNGDYSDKF